MSYIDKKLKIPRGLFQRIYFDKIRKGLYSVKIRNPEPTSPDDWYIEICKIEAPNKYEAKAKFKELLQANKELNKKVWDIINKLKQKDIERELNRLKDIVEYGEFSFWKIWDISTKALKTFLEQEGFDTTGMTREEMEELLESIATEKEPVYLIHTKRFKEYSPEGTIVIYEKQEYSDGSTKTVKVKEILPTNWTVYRNHKGVIDSIETEIELPSGMWKIEMYGLDEHPDILDDRDYFLDLIKRIEYRLYSEGKDPTNIFISGGKKPWDREMKEWRISARIMPEIEGGGGKPAKPVIL